MELKSLLNGIEGLKAKGNLDTDVKGITHNSKNVKEGDMCPNCGNPLKFKKGIEIGNTFKLGTKYSECLDLNFKDTDNTLKPVVMGCYGIGICRCMSAVVEQKNDEKGIIWPMSIAPYKVAIIIVNMENEKPTFINILGRTLCRFIPFEAFCGVFFIMLTLSFDWWLVEAEQLTRHTDVTRTLVLKSLFVSFSLFSLSFF